MWYTYQVLRIPEYWNASTHLYWWYRCIPNFPDLLFPPPLPSEVKISLGITRFPTRDSCRTYLPTQRLHEIQNRSEGEPLGTRACTLQSVMRLLLRVRARSFVHEWDNWQPKSQRGNVVRAQQTVTQTQGSTNYCRRPAKFTILQLHKSHLSVNACSVLRLVAATHSATHSEDELSGNLGFPVHK